MLVQMAVIYFFFWHLAMSAFPSSLLNDSDYFDIISNDQGPN